MMGTTTETTIEASSGGTGTSLPKAARRRGAPARLRIMGWMVLLLAVVLCSVVLVIRNLLLADAENQASAALSQELRELEEVASNGTDRATGQPFSSVRELLFNHIQRQFPDGQEVITAVLDDGEVLRQDRAEPVALSGRPERLQRILNSTDRSGTLSTGEGDLRWVKTAVTSANPTDPGGTFVVAYAIDPLRAEVNETVQRLTVVSLVGLLLAAGGAWIVAGQILAPVRLVRKTAENITSDDLTRRIPVTGNDDIAALTEQFNAMLDRLERAFSAQRNFLDDASHELRTPITIVRGHLQVMGDDPAERAAVVRLCTEELDRMSRIVKDLLLLARSEQPDFVQLRDTELAELTSDIYAKVRALGNRDWQLAGVGEGTVQLDPQRLTQAMVQLAQNAVQHTGPSDSIALGSAMSGQTVRFWLADTGPGVPEADRERIFQRFSRGHGEGATGGNQQHPTGAGLGLAIVGAIAQAHRGRVWLDTQAQTGATFVIDLPTAGYPAVTQAQHQPDSGVPR